MVELRLDLLDRPELGQVLDGVAPPVILTCRGAFEGGRFAGSEEERRRVLAAAVHSRAAFVDIEWQAGFDDLVAARRGRGIVLSHHDFRGMPPDLEARVAAMAASPAEIVKIAVRVERLSDCLTLLALARRYADRGLVVLGMGDAGLLTRICAARFGSRWTYAGEQEGPGQLSLVRMRREYNFEAVRADTTLYGLMGRPISHSLSPALHNAAMAEFGLDAVYVPLAGADADDCLAFADRFGVAGASVTAPFKADVMGRLALCEPDARAAGSVNTIRRTPSGWEGISTDGAGFLAGLPGPVEPGMRAAILGNGGAARSVARALAIAGARVTLYGRRPDAARQSAALVGVSSARRPVPRGSWDLLVNATPVGTHPDVDASAFPEGTFDGDVVYDLVYNPTRTRLLSEAEARGCRTVGGLAMLIEQARLQLAWWTGRTPSADRMREAALWRLSIAS